MGLIQHEFVIATCFQKTALKAAEAFIEQHLSRAARERIAIITKQMNSYSTIILPPDGSKEGWADSDVGDEDRTKLIDFLVAESGTGSHYWSFAEFGYGERGATVKRSNCIDV